MPLWRLQGLPRLSWECSALATWSMKVDEIRHDGGQLWRVSEFLLCFLEKQNHPMVMSDRLRQPPAQSLVCGSPVGLERRWHGLAVSAGSARWAGAAAAGGSSLECRP